ncbi:MAG TPA: DUF3592 domain-containing protein [Acidobacteriaceae bacterium]|nr:DUF3592 domain-containing protein [Acidobacteriaceae bacterium]
MHIHWWRLLAPFSHNLAYIIAAATAAGARLLQKIRLRRAAAWPSADGEVQHADVKKKNGYTVIIEYRYYARSEYHYGKYSRHFRSKTHADQFADALQGRHIQVRYQEDKPAFSVVLEDDLRMTGALQTS